MKKIICLLFLSLLWLNSFATTYYIAECSTGAYSACEAGSNGNNGTSASTPKLNLTGLTLNPGDVALFARGGTATGSYNFYNLSTTASNRIRIGAYAPTWMDANEADISTSTSSTTLTRSTASWTTNAWAGFVVVITYQNVRREMPIASNTSTVLTFSTSANTPAWIDPALPSLVAYTIQAPRPKRINGADEGCFSFTNGSNPTHNEGYILEDIDCQGDGSATGIFVYNDANYVTIQRMKIAGYTLGIDCSGTNATPDPGADLSNDHIDILDNEIENNSTQGILTVCNYATIKRNYFDANGNNNLKHNVYLERAHHVNFSNNFLVNAGRAGGGTSCDTVSLVGHGVQDYVLVSDNVILEHARSGGCYGIAIDAPAGNTIQDGFKRLYVRRNKIVNVGAVGIGLSACNGCQVENNVLAWDYATGSDDLQGIAVPDRSFDADEDDAPGRIVIRNNSIYMSAASLSSYGISHTETGSGHTVSGNLIYFGSGVSSSAKCFVTTGKARANFTSWDDNVCYRVGGANVWSEQFSTLAAAQAASPAWDVNGSVADPGIAAVPSSTNDWLINLTTRIPMVGTICPIATYGGFKRPSCAVGATDSTATVLMPAEIVW